MKGQYRIGILRQTLRRARLGGPINHWFLNCMGPGREKAAGEFIRRMERTPDGWEIEIEGVAGTLFAHTAVSRDSICQSLFEQLYPWHWHFYQIPQTKVAESDTVLDCGCAEGMFTFLNAATARRIVSFEPLPDFLDGLQRTFRGNPRISIVPAALGERRQTAYLKRAALASSITLEKTDTEVAITTIDDYCRDHPCEPSYIKADLEGYEIHMLRGAANTIKRFRPKIAITTYHAASHAREIEEFLKDLIPSYRVLTKGIAPDFGTPMMLHAW